MDRKIVLIQSVWKVKQCHQQMIDSVHSFDEAPDWYWETVEGCLELFRTGEIPDDQCREMAAACAAIQEQIGLVDSGLRNVTQTRYMECLEKLFAAADSAEPKAPPKAKPGIVEMIDEMGDWAGRWRQAAYTLEMYDDWKRDEAGDWTRPKGQTPNPRSDWARQHYDAVKAGEESPILGHRCPDIHAQNNQEWETYRKKVAEYEQFVKQNGDPLEQVFRVSDNAPTLKSWDDLFAMSPPVSFIQMAQLKHCELEDVIREGQLRGITKEAHEKRMWDEIKGGSNEATFDETKLPDIDTSPEGIKKRAAQTKTNAPKKPKPVLSDADAAAAVEDMLAQGKTEATIKKAIGLTAEKFQEIKNQLAARASA